MADKKIINNIERCIENDCDNCTWMEQTACKEYMLHDALDLINRQQVEIDRLEKETKMFADIDKMYSGIKADIIKIFVGALKEKASAKVMVANGIEVYGTKIYSINEIDLERLVDRVSRC